MRKIIFQMMTTLDGFFEGPGKEIDWHNVDEEFNEYGAVLLDSVDGLLFGRITYELMAGYWPTEMAIKNDPVIAGRMNSLPKIVFSKTLDRADWNNTRIIKNNIEKEVSELKKKPGRDLAIFGSSDLSLSLIRQGLIDEYRIIVNPLVLGNGKHLFKGIDQKLYLKLSNIRNFKSGNVMLTYQSEINTQDYFL